MTSLSLVNNFYPVMSIASIEEEAQISATECWRMRFLSTSCTSRTFFFSKLQHFFQFQVYFKRNPGKTNDKFVTC